MGESVVKAFLALSAHLRAAGVEHPVRLELATQRDGEMLEAYLKQSAEFRGMALVHRTPELDGQLIGFQLAGIQVRWPVTDDQSPASPFSVGLLPGGTGPER